VIAVNDRLFGLERLAQDAADDAYREVYRLHDAVPGTTPIEKLFCAALWSVTHRRDRVIEDLIWIGERYPLDHAVAERKSLKLLNASAFVEPQVLIAGWRVDFLIHYPAPDSPEEELLRLIVECDGHDFHERTKAQAARDRSRDRLAQHQGLPIFRFTGSEIWRDPAGCADEVLGFMAGEVRR
jgi:very-short-patch-repair endonuclease